jgi:flagellar biosynthetic protein FliQ
MTPESIIDLFHGASWVIIQIVAILVLPGLVTGLIVAVFQAATQINETTLSFVPRLVATLAALIFAGPYLLSVIVNYTANLIRDIPYMIG